VAGSAFSASATGDRPSSPARVPNWARSRSKRCGLLLARRHHCCRSCVRLPGLVFEDISLMIPPAKAGGFSGNGMSDPYRRGLKVPSGPLSQVVQDVQCSVQGAPHVEAAGAAPVPTLTQPKNAEYGCVWPILWNVEPRHSGESLLKTAFRGMKPTTITTATLKRCAVRGKVGQLGFSWLTTTAVECPAFVFVVIAHRQRPDAGPLSPSASGLFGTPEKRVTSRLLATRSRCSPTRVVRSLHAAHGRPIYPVRTPFG
jgi:hypothetical protein